jgi:copper(I)-binding protein
MNAVVIALAVTVSSATPPDAAPPPEAAPATPATTSASASASAPSAPPKTPVAVVGGWVRLPPPGAKMAAGYPRLRNTSAAPIKVVAVKTSASAKAELHTHRLDNGVMKMRKVDDVVVDAGAEIVFAPGGLHIMIMGLSTPIAEHSAVRVTFTLSDGSTIEGSLPVSKEAPTPTVPAPG